MRKFTLLWAAFVAMISSAVGQLLWPLRTLYAVPEGSGLHRSTHLNINIFLALLALAIEDVMAGRGLLMFASKFNYSQAAEQAQLAGTTSTVGNAGTLTIFSGVQPASTVGADGTLVVGPFTLGTPFAPGASAALPSVLSPTLPSNVNSTTSVQPTWARVKTSGGTAVFDMSAGAAAADMTIGTPTATQPVAITSWTITSGNSGH